MLTKLKLSIVLVFLVVLTSPVTACFWSDGDFEIRVEPCQAQKVTPGSTLDVSVYVKNVKGSKDDAMVRLIGNYVENKGYFEDESGQIHEWSSEFLNYNISHYWLSKINVETVEVEPGDEIILYLQIKVPSDAKQGNYNYKIQLNDYPCESEIEVCSIELIPEFSTIAIPAGIALLAGLFFFRRQ